MITPERPTVALTGRYSTPQAQAILGGIHRNTLKRYAVASGIRMKKSRMFNRTVYTGKDLLTIWDRVTGYIQL